MSTETTPPPDAGQSAPPVTETLWTESIYSPENPRQFTPDWISKVPEDIRKDYEPYKDSKDPWQVIEKANGRVKETQKALHSRQQKGLPEMPADPNDVEGRKAYYEARGLPDSPDGYGLKRPDGFPEQLYREDKAKEWAAFFHEKGVSPELVKELTDRQFAESKSAWEQHQQAAAAQEAAELKARTDYIQAQKETLHQEYGSRVDRELGKLEDYAMISIPKDEAKAMFDPGNPEKYIGLPAIKVMQSLLAQNPKNGDPTARMMERSAMQGNVMSWETWKSLPSTDERVKAAFDDKHPNHAVMKKARDEAAAWAAKETAMKG